MLPGKLREERCLIDQKTAELPGRMRAGQRMQSEVFQKEEHGEAS